MVKIKCLFNRWHLCIGFTQTMQAPHLMSLGVEDFYEGFKTRQCGPTLAKNYRKGYVGCSHRCPICLQMKKCVLKPLITCLLDHF
jgi:hypothetical protein